jgi:hypothetical protein
MKHSEKDGKHIVCASPDLRSNRITIAMVRPIQTPATSCRNLAMTRPRLAQSQQYAFLRSLGWLISRHLIQQLARASLDLDLRLRDL